MKSMTVSLRGEAPPFAVLRTRTKPAALWEKLLVALWCLLTFVDFPGNEVLMYPAALAFLLLFALNKDETVPIAMRCWILLMLPVLGTLSFGWSPAPAEALRAGMMMILHFIIMVTIACRLTRRDIVRCFFAAGIVTLYFAAPAIDNSYSGGVYGSKNFFANRMLIVMIAALAVALDSKEHVWLRVMAIPVGLIAFRFNVVAESATALVLAVVAILAMVSMWALWQPVTRVRHLRTAVVVLGIAIVSVATLVYLAIPNNTLVEDFLAMLGKDSTLTNRTLFWEAGNRIAQERPLFGLGLEGFWRPETGAAQTINELDFKPIGTRHSFHNSYIEAKVALGYVGMAMLIVAVAWTYARTIFGWFQSQSMATAFFLTGATIVLITSFTESFLMGSFDTMILIFYLSAITTVAEKNHVGKTALVALRPS